MCTAHPVRTVPIIKIADSALIGIFELYKICYIAIIQRGTGRLEEDLVIRSLR
jgi:hypothetical protein